MLRGHTFIGGFSQGSSNYIGANKKLRISAYLSATFLLLFFGLAVFPVASSVSDTNAARKDLQTTTLSMTSSSFYANPKVTSATGTFSSSSTEISVSTDNYTGYTLGIAAKTNDSDSTKLLSTDGELNSISSATSEEDFSAASGTSLNGLWGYKPSKLNSVANTDFLPAPSFEGDEINRTSGANEQADTYTISLGARADASTAYGRYKNTFVIRTVANPIGVSFVYNKNTEDTVDNMPANIATNLSDERIVVSNTAPTRTGYELTGWCDGATKKVLNIDYCDDDKTYDGGDDYWLDRSGAQIEVDLYAMWKPTGSEDLVCNANASTISEAVCMQDMNNDVKASMVVDQQYQLTDTRDNKKYYVAKLRDGNVWMTQNLDFQLSSEQTLTHNDTDLGWADYDDNATWTPIRDTLTTEEQLITDYELDSYSPYSYKSNNGYIATPTGYYVSLSFATLNDCVNRIGSEDICKHHTAGTYYNWTAAVATNNSNDSANNTSGKNAPNSVCPAGWRLPYGVVSGIDQESSAQDWGRLAYAYGLTPAMIGNFEHYYESSLTGLEGSPIYYTRNGYIYEGENGIRYLGEQGMYPTSTIMGDSIGYSGIYSNGESNMYGNVSIFFAYSTDRISMLPVRCVAREHMTLSFDANGGEGAMSSVELRQDITLLANTFTKTGKSFTGWNTEPDGSGTDYSDEAPFSVRVNNTNTTLYAQWNDPTVIVYDGNNADSGSVETQTIGYGHSANIQENGFVRDGYAFFGWNTESDGSGIDYAPGDNFVAETKAGETIRLYAQWSQAQVHTVNYTDASGANTVEYNCAGGRYSLTKYSHTENVDDTGRKLSNYGDNWGNANVAGTDRGDLSGAHVVTIPGATSITVTVYYNGQGTSYDWVSVWEGKHPEYNAKDNYSTARMQKLGGSNSSTYTVNGNTLSYMGRQSFTVTGDSVTFSFTSNYSSYGQGYGYYAIVTGMANNFTCDRRSGQYADAADTETGGFLGWNTYNNASTVGYASEADVLRYVQSRMESSYTSTTMYAVYGKWTNVSFDANNGVGLMNEQKIPYSRTEKLSKNTFTREGYDFYAWNDQPDGSGTYYEDEQGMVADTVAGKNITLYAQWSPKAEYTINYHNGNDVNTVKYNCWDGRFENKRVAHSANVDDAGEKTGELTTYYNSNTVVSFPGATKLHVKLTYGTNSISYAWATIWQGDRSTNYSAYSNYSQGVRLGNNTTGKYGGVGSVGENLVVEGDIPGDTITIGFYNTYGNNGYANGYGYYLEVTAGNDTMYCESEPTDGQYVAPVGDVDDVWTGWSYDDSATFGSYIDETAAKGSLTTENTTVDLYAIWAKPTILRFNRNGATRGTVDDIVIKYGESVDRLRENGFSFDDEDIKFQRWNTAADNTGTGYNPWNSYNATNPAGGVVTMYAIWGMPTYYHFDANGGEGDTITIKVPYGDYNKKVPECTFTKVNASCYRWYSNPDGTGNSYYVGNTLYANSINGEEITVYATWGNDMIIHFDANGGVGEMDDFHIHYYNSDYLPSAKFGRIGYDFAYWNTEPDGTGTTYNDKAYYYNGDINGGEMTLYAIWGLPSMLYFDANGGEGTMNPVAARYNIGFSLPANTYTKTGAVFAYWNTASDDSGTKYNNQYWYTSYSINGEDQRLYAIWGYPTVITFDANGGTGTRDDLSIPYNTYGTIPDNGNITKQDATFLRWNTRADGAGSNYNVGNSYSASSVTGAQVTMYAVWRNHTIINYDGNGADSGSMSYSAVDYGDTITFRTNTFVRNGYVFAGWSTAADGTGTTYNDGDSYTSNSEQGTTFTLYAIWQPDDMPDVPGGSAADGMTIARAYELAYIAKGKGMYVPRKDGQGGYDTHDYIVAESGSDYEGIPANEYRFAMQDMTTQICENATVIPSHVMTVDLRDNKSYWVSKLADGKCWMTQNLDLDIEGELTSENTDLNESATGPYTDGYSVEVRDGQSIIKWMPARTTIHVNTTTVNGWDVSTSGLGSVDVGDWYWTANNTNTEYCSFLGSVVTSICDHPDTSYYGTHGHIGNYYTYNAAFASNDYVNDTNTTGAHSAANSICPKNWRLPNSVNPTNFNAEREFKSLIRLYNNNLYNTDTGLVNSPVYMVRAGYVTAATGGTVAQIHQAGSYGDYNTGNADRGAQHVMYGLHGSIQETTYANGKNNDTSGRSVRCVAR